MSEIEIIADLLAAALTLMIFSFLWGENKIYRLAEHTFIGVATGYGCVLGINAVITSGVDPLILGNIALIIPILLGFLLYARFVKGVAWLSRWPIAIYVGVGIGLGISASVAPQILTQITATAAPLFVQDDPLATLNNWVTLLVVIGTLVYFFYSREHKGVIGGWAKIGRIAIMLAMGAAYANTAMARFSLLVGRVQFLLEDPAYYALIVAAVVLVGFVIYKAATRKT
jgi:hypothetical protein